MANGTVPQRAVRAAARGARATLALAWDLLRVTVPAVVGVTLLERSGWLAVLAARAAPAMGWFGLPGDAALPLLLGNAVGLYAGIAAAVPLGFAPREWTIFGTMLAISHAQLVESALVARGGGDARIVALARLLAAALAGIVLGRLLP